MSKTFDEMNYEEQLLNILDTIENDDMPSPIDESRKLNKSEKELVIIGALKELGMNKDDYKNHIQSSLGKIFKEVN